MRAADVKKAYVTLALIGVNVLIFLIMKIMAPGGYEYQVLMVRWGASVTSSIAQDGELWRLFTCIFLHFDVMHLANNMIVLFVLGLLLETNAGHWRMAAIYFLSGVGANVFSVLWEVRNGEEVLSAGASGAIFGLMGAVVFAALFAREVVGGLSLMQVILMVVLSLYHGVNEAVDDAAHLSGLVLGFLAAAAVIGIFRKKKEPPAPPREQGW